MWRYTAYDPHGRNMPFPSRATALTKPKVRNRKAKKAHAHNAESSPLLSLPAELRNLIYEYTLGHNKLHIFQAARMDIPDRGSVACYSSYICTAHLWGSDDSEHPFHHEVCGLPPLVTKLNLGLLLCCCQIYAEAALVPFMHNTFSFTDAADLPNFTSCLVPEQTTAIRSLEIGNVPADHLFDASLWSGFPNLRHLDITVYGHSGCVTGELETGMNDDRTFNALYLEVARITCQGEPPRELLRHMNLKSFQFRILCARGLALDSCAARREWQQWSEAAENMVLARPVKAKAQELGLQDRQMLQIEATGLKAPNRLSLRDQAWTVKAWCGRRSAIWKKSWYKMFRRSTQSEL